MHTNHGILVSTWNKKKSNKFNMTDMGLTFIALKEYVDRMRDPQALLGTDKDDLEPELTKLATKLVTTNADFLLKVQGERGRFCESYYITGKSIKPCNMGRPNFTGIFALLEAYKLTQEVKYVEAARKTWNYVWDVYWDEPSGLFRSTLGQDTVIIHSLDVTAQLRAYREMMFATPIHMNKPFITKFSRWAVQTLMMTGMIQSEENRSGELAIGVGSADWDNDGVPWLGRGDGEFGIAPTLALEVAVNIGKPNTNKTFNKLKGQKHWAEMYGGKVKYGYQTSSIEEMKLPIKIDYEAMVEEEDWEEREELLKWDGTTTQLPPAKMFERGSDLSGRQIFEMNCAHCHGYTGEGITGISYEADSLVRTRDDMFEVPNNGRFTRLMPEWGIGNRDEHGGVLTKEELYKIVDYIQSDGFKKTFKAVQKGYAFPDYPPKDPYFFISRSYDMGKKKPATKEDIALIMNLQRDVSKTGKPVNIIKRLIEEERYGGAVGQVKRAKEWQDENYDSVLSYTNKIQMEYAKKPVVIIND